MFSCSLFVRTLVLTLTVIAALLHSESCADEFRQDTAVTEGVATETSAPNRPKLVLMNGLTVGDFFALDLKTGTPIGNYIGLSYGLSFVRGLDTFTPYVGCYINSLPMGDMGCGTGLVYARSFHARWSADVGASLYSGTFVDGAKPETYGFTSAFVTVGTGFTYYTQKQFSISFAAAQFSCDVQGLGCSWMPSVGMNIAL